MVTVTFTVPGVTASGIVVVMVFEVALNEPMLAVVPKSTIGATSSAMKLLPWIVMLPDGDHGARKRS